MNFISKAKWNTLTDEAKQTSDELRQMQADFVQDFEQFKIELKDTFSKTTDDVVEAKFEQYEQVMNEFGKFFNQETLSQ